MKLSEPRRLVGRSTDQLNFLFIFSFLFFLLLHLDMLNKEESLVKSLLSMNTVSVRGFNMGGIILTSLVMLVLGLVIDILEFFSDGTTTILKMILFYECQTKFELLLFAHIYIFIYFKSLNGK